MNIGFIGLGDMGSRMVRHLIPENNVGVYNRTKSKTDDIVSNGAVCYESISELIKWVDTAIVMISDDLANDEVFNSGILTDLTKNVDKKLIINMSTISPTKSVELAQLVKEHNSTWDYLEAPVSGTLPHAENKELIILTGGNESVTDKARPVLQLMGKRVDYIGDVGQASKMKLLINTILATQVGVIAESLHLAEECGISSEKFMDIINNSALANGVSKAKSVNLLKNEYPMLFSYEYIIKDLNYAVAEFGNGKNSHIMKNILQVYQFGKETLETTNLDTKNLDFSAIGAAYREK